MIEKAIYYHIYERLPGDKCRDARFWAKCTSEEYAYIHLGRILQANSRDDCENFFIVPIQE